MNQIYVCNVSGEQDEGPLHLPKMDFGPMSPSYLGVPQAAAPPKPSTNLIGNLESMAGIYEDQGLDSDAGELRILAARLKVEAAQPEVTETPLLLPKMDFGK